MMKQSELTKQQLIEAAEFWGIEDIMSGYISTDSGKIIAELCRIALTALTAEPCHFINRIDRTDRWGEDIELRAYTSHLDASKSKDDHGGDIITLYNTPTAPEYQQVATSLADLTDESKWLAQHKEWMGTLLRGMYSDEDWEELTVYTWLAWRDSRRSFVIAERPPVVRLPSPVGYEHPEHCHPYYTLDKDEVIEVLKAAGIKVEEE